MPTTSAAAACSGRCRSAKRRVTYDNDGNTTASNGLGYAYDFENHLVQAGGGISIVYDGEGNRVSKTVAGVTTAVVQLSSRRTVRSITEELLL
jgi:YD repeat-containing protein